MPPEKIEEAIRAIKESGILSKIEKDGVKILGNGELTVSLKVVANKFTYIHWDIERYTFFPDFPFF